MWRGGEGVYLLWMIMSLPRPCEERSNMCDTPGMFQWRGVRFAEYCWICKCEGWQRLWFVLFSPSHLKKQTNCNRMIGQFWHETYTALHSRNTFIAWCFVFFTFHFSKSDTFYTNIHNTYTCYNINWLYIRIIENTDLNRKNVKNVKNEKYFYWFHFVIDSLTTFPPRNIVMELILLAGGFHHLHHHHHHYYYHFMHCHPGDRVKNQSNRIWASSSAPCNL